MKDGLNCLVEELGEEIIDEVLEQYFENIREEIKRSAIARIENDVKEAAKESLIGAVCEYINGAIENDALLE